MSLDDLVSQLRLAFGAELRAVVLYGSAAAGEHLPKKSDVNVLVLVESLDASRLLGASAAIRAWIDAGNPAPLTLTTREWESSSDIFAMEYADILERHRVLFGALNTRVRVDPAHLRLQVEHEAMGTLLQLRRAALAAGSDSKEQLALLEHSASTIMVVFRAVLRLRGEAPPTDNAALAKAVAGAVGTDASPFTRVVAHKRGEVALKGGAAAGVLAGCLSGMQAVVTYLDQFRHRSESSPPPGT